jgi:Heterokaryon incompatibility protein (HET)
MKAIVYLGEQYLWVDALCIIQDEVEGMEAEIDAMGDIYAGALLTLVATSSLHADAGLPGYVQSSEIGKKVAALATLRYSNSFWEWI